MMGVGQLPPGLGSHFRRVLEQETWLADLERCGHSPAVATGMILGAALSAHPTGENPNDVVRRMVASAQVAHAHGAVGASMPRGAA